MKPSNVWHGHSTRPSLPAGTVRKASGSLLHGRRNKLITPPVKKNRAFPTGNALLYISLSYVDFSGCFLRGAPCFCFVQRANCAITYYNPAQPSKCLYYTTICATFLLNAHLSGCQNYRAFLSERLRLLCQKIPDTLCSRPRNNYIRLNSALVHAIPF